MLILPGTVVSRGQLPPLELLTREPLLRRPVGAAVVTGACPVDPDAPPASWGQFATEMEALCWLGDQGLFNGKDNISQRSLADALTNLLYAAADAHANQAYLRSIDFKRSDGIKFTTIYAGLYATTRSATRHK